MTTETDQPTTYVPTQFSDEETRALERVRVRFHEDHDVLSSRERAHLRFLRWLVLSERLKV